MVALNPMPWKIAKDNGFPIHYVSAVSFFIMIGLVALFCSRKTLHYFPHGPGRKRKVRFYKRSYLIMGLLMPASPITARVFNDATGQSSWGFWMEAFGIMAFGAYWLLKTLEFHQSQIEKKAIEGRVEINHRTLTEDPDVPDESADN